MSSLIKHLVIGAGLLCMAQGQAQAQLCSNSGALGIEASYGAARSAVLNPQGSFSDDFGEAIAYGELDAKCRVSSADIRLKTLAEHVSPRAAKGVLQRDYTDQSRGLVREAYVSVQPLEAVFVDVGKKDIRNGQLFFVSPLDVLRNPVSYLDVGHINARGISWRDSYREGSVGVSGAWLGNLESIEVAWLPKLASAKDGLRVAEMHSLERTNAQNIVYFSYSSNRFEDFNPRLVAVLGGDAKVGFGLSGFFNDDLILTAEFAVHRESEIKKIEQRKLQELWLGDFPDAESVFSTSRRGAYSQLALGARYTTSTAIDVSLEYFFQEQGYREKELDRYFDFLKLSEEYYRISSFSAFRGYALIAVGQLDDLSRRDLMMGRSYLMSHVRRAAQTPRGIGVEGSAIFNVEDRSYNLATHLFSQIHRNFQIYVGAGYSAGPKRSEFAQFGNDGVGYAGVRAVW